MRVAEIYVGGVCREWLLANQERVQRAGRAAENGGMLALVLGRKDGVDVCATFFADVSVVGPMFNVKTQQGHQGGKVVKLHLAGHFDVALVESMGLAFVG